MEVALLTNGIPYSAIQAAPEDRVVKWYAVLQEVSEAEGERVQSLVNQ